MPQWLDRFIAIDPAMAKEGGTDVGRTAYVRYCAPFNGPQVYSRVTCHVVFETGESYHRISNDHGTARWKCEESVFDRRCKVDSLRSWRGFSN